MPPSTSFPRLGANQVPQPCNLDGISMNIQEKNSAHYFRVQSEREQTLVLPLLSPDTLSSLSNLILRTLLYLSKG